MASADDNTDLDTLGRDLLVAEVRRLRHGIREHRDATSHDLCWHHPQLLGSLDRELPAARRISEEHDA